MIAAVHELLSSRRERYAGILLTARSTGRSLFLREHDGTWVTPGGYIEPAETARAGALRELREETGYFGPLALCDRSALSGRDYRLFEGTVPREFAPRLSREHLDYVWAPFSRPPEPLHPELKRHRRRC